MALRLGRSSDGTDGHPPSKGIEVTVISDAAVFAIMPRVSKVLVGPHSVMASGGILLPPGGNMVAVMAKHHSVPVVVCAGMYKLCPLYIEDHQVGVQNYCLTNVPALTHTCFS